MTVILAKDYRNDTFIDTLNEDLNQIFGANNSIKFNPWHFLQEEADFINTDPVGLRQLPHWKRPISKEALAKNFFWYRYGEFSFKLSGGGNTVDEARDAVAVCKWIRTTQSKFIDRNASSNYGVAIVKEYLNYLFEEAGYDTSEYWQLPDYKI